MRSESQRRRARRLRVIRANRANQTDSNKKEFSVIHKRLVFSDYQKFRPGLLLLNRLIG
jgi:hypothetical protein